MLDGNFKWQLPVLHGSPESLTGDEKFRTMFSKEFYQKNTAAVVFVMSCILLFIGEYINLLTREGG